MNEPRAASMTLEPRAILKLRSLHPSDRLALFELHVAADASGFAVLEISYAAVTRLRRAGHLHRAARLVEGDNGLRLERGFALGAAPARLADETPVSQSAGQSHPRDNPADPDRVRSLGPQSEFSDRFVAMARGDRQAERLIAAEHLGTAERLALRLAPSAVPRDEARAAAPEALLRALRTYEHDRGVAFATHLWWCVRSAVRDLGRLYHAAEESSDVELVDAQSEPLVDLRQLPPELERVASDMVEGWSPDESAERLGLSVHQVRRARTRVREALRERS